MCHAIPKTFTMPSERKKTHHLCFCRRVRLPGLFPRINLDVAEEDFGAFGLEEDFAAGGERVGSFVGDLAVHVLPHVPLAVHEFDDIPVPVRFFQFMVGSRKLVGSGRERQGGKEGTRMRATPEVLNAFAPLTHASLRKAHGGSAN